jgi:hypothetical protein
VQQAVPVLLASAWRVWTCAQAMDARQCLTPVRHAATRDDLPQAWPLCPKPLVACLQQLVRVGWRGGATW